MEQYEYKLPFGTRFLQGLIKLAGYLVLFICVSIGTTLGFGMTDIIKFPDIFKGLDYVLIVMLGGIAGCLVGVIFMCLAYALVDSIAKAKENEVYRIR